MGNVILIYSLCSKEKEIELELCKFYKQPLDHNYQARFITAPLFTTAIANTKVYLARTPAYRKNLKEVKKEEAKHQVYLHPHPHPHSHIPNHPQQPTIQTTSTSVEGNRLSS